MGWSVMGEVQILYYGQPRSDNERVSLKEPYSKGNCVLQLRVSDRQEGQGAWEGYKPKS